MLFFLHQFHGRMYNFEKGLVTLQIDYGSAFVNFECQI